jgi:hypothetical protein
MTKNTTVTWGSNAWTLLHTISYLCNQKKDPYFTSRVKSFIRHYWKLLPCARCRKDASQYLQKNDILRLSNPEQIFYYTFTFHNHVNKKLKKPVISQEQYQNLYSSVTDTHIQKINEYTQYLKVNGAKSAISAFNMKNYCEFIRFLHSYCKLFGLRGI